MRHLLTAACLLLVSSTALLAQDETKPAKVKAPEAFLSADTLAFFRYDGYEAHKKAYDQTALAKIMKDDMGEFLEYLGGFFQNNVVRELLNGRGEPKDEKLNMAHFSKALEYLWKHGIVVGFETRPQVAPPLSRKQLTLVFPEGGEDKNRETLFGLFDVLTRMVDVQTKEVKRGKRILHQFNDPDVSVAWWQEGKHVVLTVGTESVEHVLDVIDGRKANLTSTELYKSTSGFNRYETDMRGFVDLRQIVEILQVPTQSDNKLDMVKEAVVRKLIVNQFGLNGVGPLTFHLGFDRQYQRSTVTMNVAEPKERRGLLKLVSGPVQFEAKQLPALPPDAASVSVRHVDWSTVLDIVNQSLHAAKKLGELNRGPFLPDELLDLDKLLGDDFRKDLLASLDSTLVCYNALSEGPFILGQGLAIKVKDAQKLQKILETLPRFAEGLPQEARPRFQKRTYRGADLYTLTTGQRNWFFPITYTIHKDWWVIGAYPQSVKGYIMRSEGKYKVWKATPLVQEAREENTKAGKEKSTLAAITVTNPAPTVEVGLALLPVFADVLTRAPLFGRGRGQEAAFDITKIPNAQAVTEHLFPDVTLLYDDGAAFRWENHYALDVPDWWSGLFFLGVNSWWLLRF